MTNCKIRITLPGYENLIANEVYKKILPDNKAELLLLSRYTDLNDPALHEYIKKCTKGIKIPGTINQLEASLVGLPENIKERLLLDDLWQVVETKDRNYIDIMRGFLPSNTLDCSAKKNFDFYAGLLSNYTAIDPDSTNQFNASLLLKNSVLPDKREMDILIKHKTFRSETFNIVGHTKFPEDMQTLIDVVYGALKSPVHISGLKDLTDRVTLSLAVMHLQHAFDIINQERFDSQASSGYGALPEFPPKGPQTLH